MAQASGEHGDTRPLSIFAAALRGPVHGFETSSSRFFGDGTRGAPAEVAADRLSGTIAPPAATGAGGKTLFALRSPLRLRPGQSVTLRYAYGMAHRSQIGRLVHKYRGVHDPFGASERRWSAWVPHAELRTGQGLGGAGARVGRLRAAGRLRVRGGLRPPHDHPGRLLPVLERCQSGLAELASLPASDGLRGPGDGARDPALHGLSAVASHGGDPVRDRTPLQALQQLRDVRRPRFLAPARGGRVRPGFARRLVLLRATPLLRHREAGERLEAPQGRAFAIRSPCGVRTAATWRARTATGPTSRRSS